MKSIGIVTVARSDYGIWQPVLKRLSREPDIDFWLYVAGMHLEEKYGMTINAVAQDGYEIRARIPMGMRRNDAEGVGVSMGEGVSGFARVFEAGRPDILCVLGDRFDMIPAVLAAAPFGLPVAHVHGGEITEGAMDDLFRHAITKMSHLHFASTQEYADRIIQMGEEPWRVMVSGAPGLDSVLNTELLPPVELERLCGMPLSEKPLLVTFHPATLDALPIDEQINELLKALSRLRMPIVFTLPNADMGSDVIIQAIHRFRSQGAPAVLVDNLGSQAYFSLMHVSAAMVGNSSSGIIEAASFDLPVVNIGIRQQGRARNANVIDCTNNAASIEAAIRKAVDPAFREEIMGEGNIYGNGHAADLIVTRLMNAEPTGTLIRKRFHPQEERR
ncbi:MAG: UDP-N-acetylglucosamine 2-epimerase (hydrolyzing) [Verrucomicrobia bacterium]|nr:UDP-N-acetylglucosamine 2-epimerase (hydrolyzing) [Verrucomicrobiota bacterium]